MTAYLAARHCHPAAIQPYVQADGLVTLSDTADDVAALLTEWGEDTSEWHVFEIRKVSPQ